MRKESEQRKKITSIRMPQKLFDELCAEADKKGTRLNNLIVMSLEHRQNPITPEIAVAMQNIANTACEAASDKKENIHKEMNKIWQSLK